MNHFNSSTKHKGLWMVIFFKNSNVTADTLDIWKCAFYSRNVTNLSKNPISVPAVSHVDARLCWIVAQAQTTPPTFPPLWRGTCNTHINTQIRKNTNTQLRKNRLNANILQHSLHFDWKIAKQTLKDKISKEALLCLKFKSVKVYCFNRFVFANVKTSG